MKQPDDLKAALLQLVNQPNYVPAKPKVLAKTLGLDTEGLRDLKRAIKRMVKRGEIVYGDQHLILPVRGAGQSKPRTPRHSTEEEPIKTERKPKAVSLGKDRVTGEFRRAQAGYGFVRPSATPRASGRAEDIFIPANKTGDAATGDKVLVKVNPKKLHGKPGLEGEILEVIDRETNQFVGTYLERRGQALVQIDGKVFTQLIWVGDPGAKGAQLNDKVVIEMVRFPSQVHDGEGVITKVLGARGEPGVDTLSVIHEFNLPGEFAEDTMEDARAQAEQFNESIPGGRVDFTDETVITIDPVDARDFDDAISLTRIEKGHWRLGVHIADVSHFVQPKTALDREALDRATSVYLPDQVIPMLPEIISNNLASLQPDRVRYTMTAVLEMTAEGVRVGCEVTKGAIKSARRFTYEEVDQYLTDRDAWKTKLTPDVHRLLGEMHELAMILRQRRFKRGSLELSLPELKIDLDKQGRVSGAHLVQNTESHQIIEEFMLAANEAVADTLFQAGIPFMRRIHEAPDPKKLKSLTEFVRELGFETDSLESRFAIQSLLDEVHDTPQAHAVNYSVLRSMQKAIYSPEEEGHYALASDCYCHFTSPIRRYPDLTVHRLLAALSQSKKVPQDIDALYSQAEHCSEREQRAAQAERELTKVKLLNYMSNKIGQELDGIITGVEEYGLFVQGVEIPAEGFLHINSLSDDYYHFDRTTHSLTGRRAGNAFRLGDPLRVAVNRVDVDRRELDWRLIDRLPDVPRSELSPEKKSSSSASRSRQSSGRSATAKGGRSATGQGKRSGSSAGKKPSRPSSPGKKRKRRD